MTPKPPIAIAVRLPWLACLLPITALGWAPPPDVAAESQPLLDGLEATRRIRALEGGQEIVTASVFAEQRGEMLAAGMDDILHKPFRPKEIFECLGRHLGVRYRREDGPRSPAPGAGGTVDRAALAALSDDLRRELADALLRLDTRVAASWRNRSPPSIRSWASGSGTRCAKCASSDCSNCARRPTPGMRHSPPDRRKSRLSPNTAADTGNAALAARPRSR